MNNTLLQEYGCGQLDRQASLLDQPERVIFTSNANMGCVDCKITEELFSYDQPVFGDLDYEDNLKLISLLTNDGSMEMPLNSRCAPPTFLDSVLPPIDGKAKQSGYWYEQRRFLAITYRWVDDPQISLEELHQKYLSLRKKFSTWAWREVDAMLPVVRGDRLIKTCRSTMHKKKLNERFEWLLKKTRR